MFSIRTNNLHIAYEQAGRGSTALVLVHGNWASRRWWLPTLQRLAPGYRAVAFDLRGCGMTSGPDHGYTMSEHTADLWEFLNALGIERAVLVGHSLGGAIVTQFALQWPERVQALVLVDTAPADGMQIDPSVYRQLPFLKGNRWLVAHALDTIMPRIQDAALRDALIDDAMRIRLAAVLGNSRAVERWNVVPVLHRLQMPTLIVHGSDDQLVPLGHAQRWRQWLPNSQLVTIQRCGHSPNVERPDVFARALFEFLSRLDIEYAAPPVRT